MRAHIDIRLAVIMTALLAGATPALAQDKGNWEGPYIAVEGGAAASRMRATSADAIAQVTNVNPAGTQPLTVVPGTSVTVGLHDRQTKLNYGGVIGLQGQHENFVFGVEADLHGSRNAGSNARSFTLPATALSPASTVVATRSARTRYDWSARVRLGAAMGDTLLYVSGGVAGAAARLNATDVYTLPAGNAAVTTGNPAAVSPAFGPVTVSASKRRSLIGWTAGGGIQQKLGSSGLFVGLDARYVDYGSKNYTLTGATTKVTGALVYTGAEGGTGNPIATPTAKPGTTHMALGDARLAVRVGWKF